MINEYKEFRAENFYKWEAVIKSMFPSGIPSLYEWKNKEEIIAVLNKLCFNDNLGYVFLPYGGGNNLDYATHSLEEGCIELHCGGVINIVKPIKLSFNSLGDNFDWAYFRLETDRLKSSGVYDKLLRNDFEQLTEIETGIYCESTVYINGIGVNGEEIPKTARFICRVLEGDFVIFAKASFIVDNDYVYEKMTSLAFRDYISSIVGAIEKEAKKVKYLKQG